MDNQRHQLIEGLNTDLAHELAAVIQYLYQAASVSGLHRAALRQLFQHEIEDELRHALFLADKVVALGGTPAVQPAPVNTSADIHGMLHASLQAELDTIRRYRERCRQADAAGDIGLKVALEDMLRDETRHAEELRSLLGGTPQGDARGQHHVGQQAGQHAGPWVQPEGQAQRGPEERQQRSYTGGPQPPPGPYVV